MNAARFLQGLAFAAHQHRTQRRKSAGDTPYINHPIAVANVLAVEGGITDEELLLAALLHDTVEDTGATFEELTTRFGQTVADLVAEVTDDKSLPKAARKLAQIEHAPPLSLRGKQLKLADKICNLRDLCDAPPEGWPCEQCREYVEWAAKVVAGCRGVNPRLEKCVDDAINGVRAKYPA